jgi:hypothetical protein
MWWWRRKRVQLPPTLEEQRKIREAKAAVEAAERVYEQTKRQGAEVNKVSGLLRRLRQDNNFAALIHRSMLRRPH